MRRYEQEKIQGTPVGFSTMKQRKALIGKKIGWHSGAWLTARYGIVQEVNGRNVMVSGNWEWAPGMKNVHVVPGENQ